MDPEDFWEPYELEIESYAELNAIINKVFKKWFPKNRLFAWRGQVNSSWPLYSSLYRRLNWTSDAKTHPDERDLYRKEGQILADLHRWGLHISPNVGRLSVLNQLATLQNYGGPTRLIDVTFNPWIGTWFSVEEQIHNTEVINEEEDGRLFAIDVTDRLINENRNRRPWEDELYRPWPDIPERGSSKEEKKPYYRWCTNVLAWKPSNFDSRIAAQNGGFVLGGVPLSTGPNGPNQWPKNQDGDMWKINEVRKATSIPLRPHKLEPKAGGVSQDAVYTFKIKASAKEEIRNRLQRLFGYTHSNIYPDYTGFAEFGTQDLNTEP